MRFDCDGETYDTSEMTEFPTGDACQPVIYMARHLSRVFVRTKNLWVGPAFRRADADDIRRLADWYGLPELLDILPGGRRRSAPSCRPHAV